MQRSVARKRLVSRRREMRGETRASGRGANLWSRIESNGGRGRYLVVRSLGGIGDVLMATPALRQLKADFPDIELDLALDRHSTVHDNYFSLVRNASFIDQVLDARHVARGRYDGDADITTACIHYENQGLPTLNRIDLFARRLGVRRLKNKVPFYQVEPDERRRAIELIGPSVQTIFLHTASFDDKRCWPIEHQVELVEMCKDLGVHFLVMDWNRRYDRWSRHENVTDVSGTDIRQMTALIEQSKLFVGPDSGPMHLAGAVGTPGIALFGAIPPEARVNHYPRIEGITSGLDCEPCWYKPCPRSVECMRRIAPRQVRQKLEERL